MTLNINVTNTRTTLQNLGFSQDFIDFSIKTTINNTKQEAKVYIIKKDGIRKVGSDGNIEQLDIDYFYLNEKRSRELEDIYDIKEINDITGNHFINNIEKNSYDLIIKQNSNLSDYNNEDSNKDSDENAEINYKITQKDILKLQLAVKNINKDIVNDTNTIIKAYKSSLKLRNMNVYNETSSYVNEINKLKLYHKCNYPDCNRTFSSSGWLSSHLDDHINDLKKGDFNVKFEMGLDLKERFYG